MILEMTATALISYGTLASRGCSETARFVDEQADRGRRHLDGSFTFGLRSRGVYEALCSAYAECHEPNWDGYGAEPIAEDTYRFANRFLESLPPGTPPPSVGAEADGHLTFEWYRSTDRLLSVSVSPEGMIYYAALLGRSKRSGTEPFRGDVPEDVMRVIHRLFGA
jgi:hypothetical protein